jgi:hypothetical protein
LEQHQTPTIPNQQEPPHTLLLRPEQRAPIGDGVKDLRPLARAPAGRSLTPPSTSPRQEPEEHAETKINYKNKGVDRPRSYRDDQHPGRHGITPPE